MNPFSFASMIENYKIFFGGYPCQEWFDDLIKNNVVLFINLTLDLEMKKYNLFPYYKLLSSKQYIHYPIIDNGIPQCLHSFQLFINQLIQMNQNLKKDEKIYIHCKGGHGRSGLVVACLLSNLLNINPETALHITTMSHSIRPNLKPKYKNIKCPQIFSQRKYVMDFCKPIFITDVIYETQISKNVLDFLISSESKPLLSPKYKNLIAILLFIRSQLYSRLQMTV
jgi:hypothetical protein